MLATFGTGARLKFNRGDTASARRRLAEGLDIARTLQLPRLEAGLLNETARLAAMSGEPIDESLPGRITSVGAQGPDETGYVTAELADESQIRLLLIDGSASALAAACARARTRLEHVDHAKRPRAHLHATVQLALCLATTGNADEAQDVLAPALRTCAALGLSQLLIDEGPQMIGLAKECVTSEGSSADDVISANVREFAQLLAEKPAL
jgi:serine/threonine-protein kinase PknK